VACIRWKDKRIARPNLNHGLFFLEMQIAQCRKELLSQIMTYFLKTKSREFLKVKYSLCPKKNVIVEILGHINKYGRRDPQPVEHTESLV
jgi:hypothetical protein